MTFFFFRTVIFHVISLKPEKKGYCMMCKYLQNESKNWQVLMYCRKKTSIIIMFLFPFISWRQSYYIGLIIYI